MKKVFVIAMDCEAAAVEAALENKTESVMFGRRVVRGTIGGEETAVIVTGVGKVNAAAGAQLALSTLGAEILLNVGVAGGLCPKEMKVGDIYCIEEATQYDFDLSEINHMGKGVVDECKEPYFKLQTAGPWPRCRAGSGDKFSNDWNEIEWVHNTFGNQIREMEVGAIAHVAYRAGVPLYSWKMVSDVAEAGHGAMPEQYLKNLKTCLELLEKEVPSMFRSV